MSVNDYTSDLYLKDGIYFSKKESNISYPEKGNHDCYQIEENSFWFNHRNNCIIEAVKKYSKKNIFFDIGGGNGYVSKGLENAGINSILIEPGLEGCLNAHKRGIKTIICSTLEEANFRKNSLQNVGLFDVVEHIENDLSFLKMVNDYLVVDGLVFITVPAYNFLWSNEDVDAGHFRRYSTKEINEKLKQSGFEIVYSSYIFSILPIPVFLFRKIPSVLGLNKKKDNIEKHKAQHSERKGFISKILDVFWNKELDKIRIGKKINYGGSCFIVAKKS